jgi:hypothetical protein
MSSIFFCGGICDLPFEREAGAGKDEGFETLIFS